MPNPIQCPSSTCPPRHPNSWSRYQRQRAPVGPPGSVAIAPDESFALVTGGMKLDPNDPKKMVPDHKVSVIDLKAQPPKVVQTIAAGKGAAGISVNRTGTLALVANRNEGAVSVFTIADGKLKEAGEVALGDDKSGPSQPVFTRDAGRSLEGEWDSGTGIAVLYEPPCDERGWPWRAKRQSG